MIPAILTPIYTHSYQSRHSAPKQLHAYTNAVQAQDNGLILRGIQDSVAFCPPLIITEAQVGTLADRFARSLDEAAKTL